MEDTRTLDDLREEAVDEGGRLTVYAGGDLASQQESTVEAFGEAYPEIDLRMVVDYSKLHDVRIDRQLASDRLVPDVAQLQTTFDFPRWKAAGELLDYRPPGWDAVADDLKDPDGTWTSVTVYAFSYLQRGTVGPASPEQLADPAWRGKIVSSHPGDDDATLFLLKRYVERYGWSWLAAFATNDVRFRRGTNSPGEAVADGSAAVGVAGAWGGQPEVRWMLPPEGHPFLAWGQRAAIFRRAPHPAAARLYLAWMLSPEVQREAFRGWSVRTDMSPEGGPVWELPDAGTAEFVRFMDDRAAVERWRQTMNLYLGEPRGEPTPGWLGLEPTGAEDRAS